MVGLLQVNPLQGFSSFYDDLRKWKGLRQTCGKLQVMPTFSNKERRVTFYDSLSFALA
jgi:hypothetical protein